MKNPTKKESGKLLSIPLSMVILGLFMGTLLSCAQNKFPRSGFLDDYSKIKPHPTDQGFYVYNNPDKKLGDYSRFFVQHVVVLFSNEGLERKVDPTKINELSEYLRNQIIEALKGKYTLTGFGQRRPGTLAIAIAITDLKPAEKNSGGASMEFKLVDYSTDEIVTAGVIVQTTTDPSSLSQWTPTRTLFQNWATRLRTRLDEIHS